MSAPSGPGAAPVIGIDIGGSKVAAALVSAGGGIEALEVIGVPAATSKGVPDDPANIDEVLLAQIDRLISVGCESGRAPLAVGVGAAGWIDAEQVIRFSPHLPWREDHLAERVGAKSSLPLRLVNDAKAAAWAEHRFGAGAGYQAQPGMASHTMVMLTLGTGIGGAVVHRGELLLGRNSMAGEFGHMVMVPGGRPCQCGGNGCWEQYASGNALRALARTHGVGGEEAGPATTAAARAGDERALELLAEVGRWLGLGLANLVAALDPDQIVIGGGLGEAGELLLTPAREALGTALPGRGHRTEPELVAGALGNRAGLVGAADLARRAVGTPHR